MPDREQEEYELKERERICNLNRNELVHEYVDGWSLADLLDYVYECIYADDLAWDDDTLRHKLLQDI